MCWPSATRMRSQRSAVWRMSRALSERGSLVDTVAAIGGYPPGGLAVREVPSRGRSFYLGLYANSWLRVKGFAQNPDLWYTESVVDRSEIARLLAAGRKRRQITCAVCGAKVEGFGKQRYCSKKCANKASYHRVKGRKQGQ